MSILLVDDDRDSCYSMAKCLQLLGYDVESAYDPRTALKLVEQKQFGLAITDYQMPRMNGVEMFQRMRQLRPDLPGILLTGFATHDIVSPATKAGIEHVLTKPANFKELTSIIDEVLGGTTVADGPPVEAEL